MMRRKRKKQKGRMRRKEIKYRKEESSCFAKERNLYKIKPKAPTIKLMFVNTVVQFFKLNDVIMTI
jgi:hypothetical protein